MSAPSTFAASSTAVTAGRTVAIPAVLFCLLALVPFAAMYGSESYLLGLFTRVMIFGIAAMALDLICGYGGLVSFGHAAFMGIGAYAVGILGAHGINDVLISLPVALGASALFALATGAICLRTRGVYFIMITLAFGQMIFFTAGSLAPYGGDDGLTINTRSTLLGWNIFASDRVFFYATFALLLLVYLFCRALTQSRFGRVFRATRDNSLRATAVGYDVYRFQLVAYVIAGTIAGLAGFLFGNATEFVSPAYMSWQRSGDLIIMVLFGGIGTIHGAVIGAAAFLLTEEWLSGLTEQWKLIFGPILVLVVLFARGGLLGLAATIFAAIRKAAGAGARS